MIKVGFITNYFIFLFSKSKQPPAYQNAEEDCTLGYRYHIRYIYRNYYFAEYSIYSAKYDYVCHKRTIPDFGYRTDYR